MSKTSNPTLIGTFVVGAAVLLAVSVAIFGGSELLAKRQIYVAYFTENTQGLRAGSNVVLNGVRIGHVSAVALIIDAKTFSAETEVTIEILRDSFIVTDGGEIVGVGLDDSYKTIIVDAGLRAALQVESFITGQLLVELDFRPETEPVLRGGDDPPYPEIPTIQSQTQEMLAKVQTLIGDFGEAFDIKKIGEQIENTLEGLSELTNSEDLRESLAGINSIINRNETQELTASLQATLKDLRSAASDASTLLKNGDAKLESLQPAIDKLVVTLDEAQATLAAAKLALQGESTQVYQLGSTLREVEAAARALREFLDYLEQNPESLLRGKQ
jgi:paraquat-inducible protein B